MNADILRTTGMIAPPGFNSADYNAVNVKVAGRDSGDVFKHFAAAWNAVPYRFRAALEHETRLTASLGRNTAPQPEERFAQDHDLFGFANSAISTVECFFFAMHCVGAMADPKGFPLTRDEDLNFKPDKVAQRFTSAFGTDPLAGALQACLWSAEWKRLKDFRITLFHRGTFLRRHSLGGEGPASAIAANPKALAGTWAYTLALDATTTAPLVAWLVSTLNNLLAEGRSFADRRL